MSDKPTKISNKSRRRVLQKAGVAGGAAAVTAWTKPSLNSVILPAHAQTSPPAPMALGGATSNTPLTSISGSGNQSIASRALDALIPEAHAGLSPFSGNCGVFTINGPDDYTHCIALTFDEMAPNSGFSFDLTGPDVYYGYCYYGTNYTYYEGVANFTGSDSGTLTGQDFVVTIGDFEFSGTVADDFESASGIVVQTSGNRKQVGNFSGGSFSSCETGYGAYWSVDLTSSNCSLGAGAANSGRTIVPGATSCLR